MRLREGERVSTLAPVVDSGDDEVDVPAGDVPTDNGTGAGA